MKMYYLIYYIALQIRISNKTNRDKNTIISTIRNPMIGRPTLGQPEQVTRFLYYLCFNYDFESRFSFNKMGKTNLPLEFQICVYV